MSFKQYNPEDVALSINGVTAAGFADGTFITLSYDDPRFTGVTGADGEHSIAKTASRVGTLTLTLAQTSATNDYLSGLLQAHMRGLTKGVGAFLLKDISGTTVAAGTGCYIENTPEVSFAKEVGTREWVIKVARLELFVGGN